tara:strand:- start:858 stop:1892 length:1035 start_codon:yes stop_codon:yes gene_type:complete
MKTIASNNPWLIKEKQRNNKPYKTLITPEIGNRSSYSSWINKKEKILPIEEFKDYEDNSSIIQTKRNIEDESNNLLQPNPLSQFPKGKNAGTCLHKILERFNFHENNSEKLVTIIKEELINHQIDLCHTDKVKEAIKRIINTSLGEELKNKRLVDIYDSQIIKEMRYDLLLSKNDKLINANDIAKCFELDNDYQFSNDYFNEVKKLKILSKGFHTGFIDCIIGIGEKIETSKWWIIDWKSNFISDEKDNDCIPLNYDQNNMGLEMIKHHYPLQSHLYLLALHRFLKWRLINYDPNKNLGGYLYIFIRGLPENNSFHNGFTPGLFRGNAPVNRIKYLDNLFKNGN